MAEASEYLSLTQAIEITGVSEPTLARFAEAGYFKTRKDSDGQLSLNKQELCTLFKIKIKSEPPRCATVTRDISLGQQSVAESDHYTSTVIDDSYDSSTSNAIAHAAESELESSKLPSDASIEANSNASHDELLKLRALNELHEKYITYKESEVRALTEERNWLRTRLEKLEEKSDRDQLILVSMSETQRRLVNQIDKPKSGLISILQKVGLLPAPETTSQDTNSNK